MISSRSVVQDLQVTQLNDPEGVTWTEAQLISALNQALRMLQLLRPDATAKHASVNAQEGVRQTIPIDGVSLIRVVCNIRSNGARGQVIRLVQKEDLDSASGSWMQATGLLVKEYMYDSRIPKQFFIYPAVTVDKQIEIEYSARADTVTSAAFDNDLPVDAIYAQPLQELMMYKLLSGDATNGSNGAEHLQIAMELLGVKDEQAAKLSAARKGGN